LSTGCCALHCTVGKVCIAAVQRAVPHGVSKPPQRTVALWHCTSVTLLSAAALWPLAVSDAVLRCAALPVGAADHRNKVMRRACPQQRVREHERAQRVPVVIVYSDFPVTLTACSLPARCAEGIVSHVSWGHAAMVSQPAGDGLSHRRTAVPLTTGGSHQPAMHRTAPHRIQGAVGSSSDALRTSSAFRLWPVALPAYTRGDSMPMATVRSARRELPVWALCSGGWDSHLKCGAV
jgi:hypothetical protein